MGTLLNVAIQMSLVDLASRGLTALGQRMKALAAASDETRKAWDKMVSHGKIAGIATVATMGLARGLKPAVGLASGLQEEMLGVQAELSESGKKAAVLAAEMAKIKETALIGQAKTPFDVTQFVGLEKALIKAGAKVSDIVGEQGAAAASAALATYENMDPTATAEALVKIGTPFKVAASQYMALADSVARAASASTTGAAEIAEGAKFAAGPMASLGKSTDEMLALSAVMAQVGVTGSMAGTSLKNFFLKASESKQFRAANGDLKSTAEIISILRKKYGEMGEAKRAEALKKIFGEEGMPVAIALLNKGAGSYEQIIESMKNALPLQAKMALSLQGFNKQWVSLAGSSKSILADLFQPALQPLSDMLSLLNRLIAGVGALSQKAPKLSKIISYGAGGLLATGAAIAGIFGVSALLSGRKVLSGVGGWKGLLSGAGGTAAGIAKGKAIEAATGVQPVFVTNWPVGYSAGLSALPGFSPVKNIKLLSPPAILGAGAALAFGVEVGGIINTGISKIIQSMTGGKVNDLGELVYDRAHHGPEYWRREDAFNAARTARLLQTASPDEIAKLAVQQVKSHKPEVHVAIDLGPERKVTIEGKSCLVNSSVNRGGF